MPSNAPIDASRRREPGRDAPEEGSLPARAGDGATSGGELPARLVYEASSDCVKLLGPDGRLSYMNDAGHCLMEVEGAGQLIGQSWTDSWPEESRAAAAAAVTAACRGQSARFTAMCPTLKGTPKWWDVTITPMYSPARELETLLCVSRDVTAVRAAENALKESRRRIDTLLANLPGAAYRCGNDEAWTMEVVSEGMTALTGYTPEEMIGNRDVAFGDLIHPEDRAGVVELVAVAVKSREPFCLTYRLLTRAGVERTVWERGRAVYDESGVFVALEGFITDVTEKNSLEAQLRQAQRMEAVGRLAGGIAHDFNNILTVIQTYSELLLQQVGESSPLRGDVLEIKDASLRAATLTRQLLAFSRTQILQPKVIDLPATLATLEPMLKRLIGEDITVELNVEPEGCHVMADPGQLDQVVMNLVVNARDAMPNGGELRISVTRTLADPGTATPAELSSRAWVRLAIADTGCGMDDATLGRMYEPYFTTKEVGKGTGLGLATVHGIVKQSGGHIRCTSRVGGGSTFDIYLPRVDELAESVGAGDPPGPARGTETVLLVEDDHAVRSIAHRVLVGSGYTVLDAANGRQALELAERHGGSIDLLVTDVVMPEMGGRELCERVRRLCPRIRVLYMSGYTEDHLIRAGISAGTSDFLDKPFTTQELASAVRRSLDRPVAGAVRPD